MSIHHLPADIDHKFAKLISSLEEVRGRLDQLTHLSHRTQDMSGGYELECSACTGLIRVGNACIDISRKVEQHELVDGHNFVTVIDSDTLVTFCAECGNQHVQVQSWRNLLREYLEFEELENLGHPEGNCDMCHCRIPDGWARVTIELMISQVEGNPENAEGGVHIPILAEGIFVFCPSCGNSMSRDNLREVIHALLNAEEEEPHW